MDFDYPDQTKARLSRLDAFMRAHVYPCEEEVHAWSVDPANLWVPWPKLDELKARARSEQLWNLFLPRSCGEYSPGLTHLEYAPLAEMMGRVPWASEVFNCHAPDSGNMELLARYASDAQKKQWLEPLLDGSIHSAFSMTEPEVASSDATNLRTSIRRDGDDYVINGRKWWTSGVMDPRCTFLIVMGVSDTGGDRHHRHSMIIVPRDATGLRIVRHLTVFGHNHSPGGHAEIVFENVRVPADNMILGEGRGFEIAQGRLGPGRIHHCMRSIGQAQRALEWMARRATSRTAFGASLSEHGTVREDVALSFCEIEQARLLTLKAADAMDRHGAKGGKDLIAAIKVVASRMAQLVTDRAIQVHGAMGLSADTPIAEAFALNRMLRIADGPDAVHLAQLGRWKIAELSAMDMP